MQFENRLLNSFTPIPNDLINNREISRDARFLFVYLASKPSTWKFNNTDIKKALVCSEKSLNKYFKELIDYNWIVKEQNRDDQGKFTINKIIICSDGKKLPDGKNCHTVTDGKKLPDGKNCRTVKIAVHSNTNLNNSNTNLNNSNTDLNVLNSEEFKTNPKKPVRKKPVKTPKKNLVVYCYTDCMSIYYEWFRDYTGAPPKIDMADGKALKQIINYFISVLKNKNLLDFSVMTDEDKKNKIIAYINKIFNSWSILDPFLAKQTKLTQITSNLNNIIADLKIKLEKKPSYGRQEANSYKSPKINR